MNTIIKYLFLARTLIILMGLTCYKTSGAINVDWLLQSVKSAEKTLNARIGIAVIDHETKNIWNYRGNERFPMNSTFKAYLCATTLAQEDANILSQNKSVTINKTEIISYSPYTENFISPKKITTSQLCEAAVSYSDNTAANKLLEVIGGPVNFNTFMKSIGDVTTHLDRNEPELNEGTPGDTRDTTTPLAATTSLEKLFFGNYLSEKSKTALKGWMLNDRVADGLLRKALPKDWQFADKTGAGGFGSRSIVAVVYPVIKKPLIVSIYITQTKAAVTESNEAIARIGMVLFNALADK